jgi:hypothetical protein
MGSRSAFRQLLTPGGFEETSYVTRFTPDTSFVMREDIRRSTSGGKTYLMNQWNKRQAVLGNKCCALPISGHEVLCRDSTQSDNLKTMHFSRHTGR